MPASGSKAPTDPSWLQSQRQTERRRGWGTITQAVRAGDEAAFDQLYASYCDRLYRYLLVLTRGQEELARDVLQAAWIKVINAVPQIDEEPKLWHWLATVARNCWFDTLRRRDHLPNLIPLLEDQPFAQADAPDDFYVYRCLELELQALDPDAEFLVRGFYFKGQSHNELAELTGTTAKAVESKLARLRHRLQRALLKHLGHEDA